MTLGWMILAWVALSPVTEGAAPASFSAATTAPRAPAMKVVDFTTGVVDDGMHVFTSPARMSARDWGFAAAAVGTLGVVAAFDKQLLESAQSDALRPLGNAARVVEPLGRGAANLLIIPFFLYGAIADDARAADVAVDLAATSLVGTVLLSGGLKMAVGRSRPKNNEGTYHFEPFSWRSSFPSADASRAFGLAAVLTEHYSSLWFQVPAYATAGLVAFGRVRKNSHFPSDVVAGSLIGYSVGKSVARYHPAAEVQVSVLPGEALRVGVVWKF